MNRHIAEIVAGASMVLAVAGFAGLAGCSGSQPIRAGSEEGFDEERAAADVLQAQDAYPPSGAETRAFRVVEGDHKGRAVRIERRPGDAPEEFSIARYVEGDDEPLRIDHCRREADGSVVLLETENRDRKVISRYLPPLVLAPAELRPGEPFEQKLTLTIHPIKSPDREQDRGEATNRVRLAAEQDVSWTGSARSAARVESVFEASLSAAKVLNTTDRWIAPGEGMIAERYDERATAFGIVVSRRQHLYVAADADEGLGRAAAPAATNAR